MIQVWEIDENNFYTGKSYFVDTIETNHVTKPLLTGYIKSKWDNVDWTEGATEEEIQAWVDSQPKPQSSEMQVLQKQMTELIINQL